jgi:hypothetical protein
MSKHSASMMWMILRDDLRWRRGLRQSPEQFRPVLAERLARLVSLFQRCRCSKAEHVQQNTLPQLSLEGLKQAKADIVYLKSILDDEGMNIAQVRAGAVYSART